MGNFGNLSGNEGNAADGAATPFHHAPSTTFCSHFDRDRRQASDRNWLRRPAPARRSATLLRTARSSKTQRKYFYPTRRVHLDVCKRPSASRMNHENTCVHLRVRQFVCADADIGQRQKIDPAPRRPLTA